MIVAIVAIAFVAFVYGKIAQRREQSGESIPLSVSLGFWFLVGLSAFAVVEGFGA